MADSSGQKRATPKLKNNPVIVLQREKRIPKRLWNTPEAQVRRLKLHSASQRRYRARKAAEKRLLEERQHPDSSSSSDDEDRMSGIAQLDSTSEEEGNEQLQRQYPGEAALAIAQNVISVNYNGITCNRIPNQEPPEEEDDLAVIVKKFAQIKACSNVSEEAIEKMFKMFCQEKERINRLLLQRRITQSYKKSIKPQALKCIPTVFCSYYIEEKTEDGQTLLFKTKDVREIPTKYLNIPPTSQQKLLRMESYVKLADIKQSFIRNHGTDKLKEHLANCHVSVDGVKESAKGKRTFIIVTLRIHQCLYVYRVFNPLLGNQRSKPSPVEILRWVMHLVKCSTPVILLKKIHIIISILCGKTVSND